ncbi:MAG: hydrogenase formation protein HypD [Candidatus Bipolaricaulota bacterium]
MSHPFRLADPRKARDLSLAIHLLAPSRTIKLVHVCGTHEIAIARHGLRRLLPDSVQILEGPGCPVCVTPAADIERAVRMSEQGAIVCTYGDMLRVPGRGRSLDDARAAGADVRTVLSADEVARIARATSREVVFFAVGFETTAPMTAAVALDAPPPNLSFLVAHKLIPPAMAALLDMPEVALDGYLAPGHVSTILGSAAYEPWLSRLRVPVVIGGFEPLDVLYALALLVRQIRDGLAVVENAYPRAVSCGGNEAALRLIRDVFEPCDAAWRGIGEIPLSGLRLLPRHASLDALARFEVGAVDEAPTIPGCRCAEVLTARAVPSDCPLFATRCTPLSPVGPCMVGAEGACAIWFRYRRKEVP